MWPFGKSIADRVRDNLNKDAVMSNFGLDVSERGGVVSFSGTVPNARFVDLLSMFTTGIHGVNSVDISGVSYPAQTMETTSSPESEPVEPEVEAQIQAVINSSALAKAVHRAIRNNGELKDDPIDVLQSGDGVVLRGAVDSQHEYNLAVQIAQGVPGVNSVDDTDLKVEENAKAKAKAEVAAAGGGAPVNIPDEWHIVTAGETLSGIAQEYYGDAGKYKDLARANNIMNPDKIRVGQKIQIPR
jgi:osmotically-inducible protein OsmY